jgi:hypothetical protein
MKALVEYLAQSLVDDPAQVVVTETLRGSDVLVELRVAQPDMGRVIGKSGRVIQALRALVQACGTREGQRAQLELLED